jgi:glycosyltransferase involved in cell wall biosynthesis
VRLACYGFVERDAGSVASAGFVILRALLDRGHEIDFFGKKNFVYPRELEAVPGFRLLDVPNERAERLSAIMGRGGGKIRRHLAAQFAHQAFARGVLRAMRQAHRDRQYDLQFWFGDWAWGRIQGVPVVSWTQGPPETDSRSVTARSRELLELCGLRAYLPLRGYAAYRATLGLPPFRYSDLFIVGSRWARERLSSYGIEPSRIRSLPYPVDLEQFSPDAGVSPADPPLVLWLGRIVPRKRLDLFLDACARLISAGHNLQVMVVGGFGFVPQYRRMIDLFPYPGNLRHIERLDRGAVIPLLRSAAVVVQPSEDENFGSTVAEALSCGTPVVVGPTNGTGDYIGDGGVRFDLYETGDVAAAIKRAIESGPCRTVARRTAETFLDAQVVVDKLVDLLRAVSDSHPGLNRGLKPRAAVFPGRVGISEP